MYYPLLKSTPEKQKSITRIHRKVRNNIFNTINQNYDDPKGLVLADLPKFERTKGGKTQISVSPILRKSCSEKKVLPMLDIKPLLRNQDKTAISSISNSIYFSPKDLNLKANLISNEFQENQILMTRSGKRVNTERAVKSSLGFRGMKRNSTISS